MSISKRIVKITGWTKEKADFLCRDVVASCTIVFASMFLTYLVLTMRQLTLVSVLKSVGGGFVVSVIIVILIVFAGGAKKRPTNKSG